MHWNHRVMRREANGESYLQIVEAYYDDNIIGWTEQDVVWAEDIDALRECLTRMIQALDEPVLDEEELLQRAEELEAMGADVHEVGIDQLGRWENDGGTFVSPNG